MTMTFYVLGAMAAAFTLAAVVAASPVYALVSLAASFVCCGAIMYVLGAAFPASIEVIIYAGAIMVLFLFAAIMFTETRPARSARSARRFRAATAAALACVPAVVLCAELFHVFAKQKAALHTGAQSSVVDLGGLLLGPYGLGVELASLLLLSGIIGAFYCAQEDDNDKRDQS